MIGQTVSHYRIIEKLGSGGMGVVYLAEDTRLNRRVAIKFLPPGFFKDSLAIKRFQREVQAAAALSHPHICMVHDVGESKSQPYLVMEWLRGSTLRQHIDEGTFSLKETMKLAVQISSALEAAHTQGIIHRDIKPGNIFITTEGFAKILDFGLAKQMSLRGTDPTFSLGLTRTGVTPGTLPYMSPEQLRGNKLDARTDIFSFGLVLYEMISGVHPLRRKTAIDTSNAIINEDPQPISRYVSHAPEKLEQILKKLLCKNASQRYASMSEVISGLEQVQEDFVSPAPFRPPKLWWGAAIGAALLLIVFLVSYFTVLDEPDPPVATRQVIPLEERQSIAVLPFANVSQNVEDQWFSDGITEEVTSTLAKFGELKVVSRTSVMRYRNSDKNLKEIARELGVTNILEGSARQSQGRVRITAQLIDAMTDTHLWADSYERQLDEIFEIQTEVARQIASALRLTLYPSQNLNKLPTSDIEAYTLYLRGSQESDPFESFRLLQAATARDPEFVQALAALAYRCWYLHSLGVRSPSYKARLSNLLPAEDGQLWTLDRVRQEAEQLVERGLALDNSSPEIQVTHGVLLLSYHLDWLGAEAAFRRAIELDPGHWNAYRELALLLSRMGRHEEALPLYEHASQLEPERLANNLALAYLKLDRMQEALDLATRAAKVYPLWNILAELGRFDEALQIAAQDDYTGPFAIAYLQAKAGRVQEARRTLTEALNSPYISRSRTEEFGDEPKAAWRVAPVYAALGQKDEAFRWLDEGDDWSLVLSLNWWTCRRLDSLRSDPRFDRLLRRINLEPIPAKAGSP